jgi:hypothetical protein
MRMSFKEKRAGAIKRREIEAYIYSVIGNPEVKR